MEADRELNLEDDSSIEEELWCMAQLAQDCRGAGRQGRGEPGWSG